MDSRNRISLCNFTTFRNSFALSISDFNLTIFFFFFENFSFIRWTVIYAKKMQEDFALFFDNFFQKWFILRFHFTIFFLFVHRIAIIMRWAVARSLLREEALQKEVSAVQKKVSAAFSTTTGASSPNKNDTPTRTLSSVPLPQRKESLESNINIVTSTVPGK